MKDKAVKVLPSPFIAIGGIAMVLMGFGLLFFSFLYPTDEDYLPVLYSLLTIFLGVLPIITVIGLSYRGYYSV
ncbi:MAG: hypothetical protein HFK08_03895, partial [Clostridia bacterium]|nr:hypothetical protein [Clostridia bacterium]